jgi:hypothetical protein
MMIVGVLVAGVALAGKLRIGNSYTPLNSERPVRERTEYIVLHTTEGGDRSSLRRVQRYGLAHYVVLTDGRVRRVVHKHRVARHAGRSLWNGHEGLDEISIGIEVVGYHNRPLTGLQEDALRELLRQLQGLYDIPDENVVTHSQVAYGRPNRWHDHAHRGRKRCGMLFAQPDLRARLGLEGRPTRDPDVASGRLEVADPFLATVLFGGAEEASEVVAARFSGDDQDVITGERTAWFIARDEFDSPRTLYVFPDGSRLRGHQIDDWSRLPAGTRVLVDQDLPAGVAWRELGRDGRTAGEVAGTAYDAATTVYVKPGGQVRRGDELSARDFRRLPVGTRVFLGFEFAGTVTRGRTAYQLCGPRYRDESTLYVLPGGRVRNGMEIEESRIPGGTHVLLGS